MGLPLIVLLLFTLSVASVPTQAAPSDPWRSVAAAVSRVAPDVSFIVAEAEGGDCRTLASVAGDERLGVASTFKLYVLGALARQVAAGDAEWDEQIAVSSRWKSKASGAMRYETDGTRHSLRYFAERMMAESDNTATDHLIARLGRENVEATQSVLGHGAPEMNTPFLLTRELFALKLTDDAALIDRYLRASEDDQRAFLDQSIGPVRLAPEGWGTWSGPRWVDQIEWFASATDLCRAWARLDQMADHPKLTPLDSIMAINDGRDLFRRPTWTYAAFKEGYESGVYSMSWLLHRADGRAFVLVAIYNDSATDVKSESAWLIARAAAPILAKTP